MALGAVFSALEVMPLTFLTVEAWSFLQLGARQESRSATPFPHRWAVMFLVAVGFWNFLGAGIFGFLINLPIVSYYEIGTALTANHGHTAMMGVYGMLAVGLAIFCLRYLIPADRWSDRAAKMSFWGLNIGLAWMSFATLFPLGIRQLYESVNVGYFDARSLDYLSTNTNTVIEWLRLPGDLYFIARRRPAAALPHLPGRPPHGQAGGDRGAGGDPVHRGHRAEGAGRGAGGERPSRPRACSPPATGSSWRWRRSGSTSWRATRTVARSSTGPPGFTYLEHVDAWECPEGERLHRVETDLRASGSRATGPGPSLQRLPSKGDCTDSDGGREVTRALDPGRTPRRAAFTAGSPSRWSASGSW